MRGGLEVAGEVGKSLFVKKKKKKKKVKSSKKPHTVKKPNHMEQVYRSHREGTGRRDGRSDEAG